MIHFCQRLERYPTRPSNRCQTKTTVKCLDAMQGVRVTWRQTRVNRKKPVNGLKAVRVEVFSDKIWETCQRRLREIN